jgi:hypothetical protein
MKINQHNSFF